ncbi:MAG: ATP-dependent helicase HepA [Lentisphaerae bacterium ADurb.BinA184]|nr:MAG: ATP-dependent helicase HepA [Lentisphaerae bacterium ADurb.BinA184]
MTEPAAPQALVALLLPDELLLEWQPAAAASPDAALAVQQETFRRFHAEPGQWLFRLGFVPADCPLHESLDFWRRLSAAFARELALTPEIESLRHRATVAMPPETVDELLSAAPLGYGFETLDAPRLAAVWDSLNAAFRAAIQSHTGSVESFVHGLRPDLELAGRVFFHLVENPRGQAPFAFLATYSTRLGGDGTPRHLPLQHALQEFGNDQRRLLDLLATVHRAARRSRILPDLLTSGRIFHPLAMESNRALAFLKEVPLYEQSGIRCRIPNWWTAKAAHVTVSVRVGDRAPSTLGLDALVACMPSLCIGDQPISPEEAERLLAESDGLVLIKNRWVEVDQEKLRQTLAAYQKARELLARGLTLREAMRMLLAPGEALGDAASGTQVTFGEWLADVVRRLAEPELVRAAAPGPGFRAVLRPYQQVGLNWLAFLDSLGFGPCLADDMGLGKTIEVLAFLSLIRQRGAGPSLLVVPASLIGNWQDEIGRFLPDLRVLVAHATAIGAQAREGIAPEALRAHELVITTYGMVQRCEWLRQASWHYAILDEAQAIKNPGARQSRAVKELKARNRLILTGTPVENRLADLWSLFDFLNPGLLGSTAEFSRIARRLQDASDGYARLRRVISPYLLRRLKTDKAVISDLPDKVEMKTYAELSAKQVVLYRKLVADLKATLENAEGIQRRGAVLAFLMRFKQLCNHPDHLTGGRAYEEAESGKFARLREVCETILAKHEYALVFTQFRELTEPLDRFLAGVFGHRGLLLHGGVPVGQRRERVEQFQNSRDYVPYMVLSVKAGGVGLNLTRANHVIHFDRWWNPAVEDQATDRAFRIGQTRNVIVHKFITRGTVEEKIDRLIAGKVELAGQLIAATGEQWITEMDNRELAELFTLSLA